MKKIIAFVSILLMSAASVIAFQVVRFLSVSKGEKIPAYQEPRQALLVIDIQKAFSAPGAGTIDETQSVSMISSANALSEFFGKAGLPVVYVKTEYDAGDAVMNFIRKNRAIKGSPETAFDDRLRLVGGNVFTKNTIDSFANADFEGFLTKNRVNHLVVTGLEARYCVFGAVSAALSRGYRVTVVSDGVASVSDESLASMMAKFREMGANVATTAETLKDLGSK